MNTNTAVFSMAHTTPFKIKEVKNASGETTPIKFSSPISFQNQSLDNKNTVASKEDLLLLQGSTNNQLAEHMAVIKQELEEIKSRLTPTEQLSKLLEEQKTINANLWTHCVSDRESIEDHETRIKSLEDKVKSFSAAKLNTNC